MSDRRVARIVAAMLGLVAGASALANGAIAATWFARLSPENSEYVEITVDTRMDRRDLVFREMLGMVEFTSSGERVPGSFWFTDEQLAAVTGGQFLRRYYPHGLGNVQAVRALEMRCVSGPAGGKADGPQAQVQLEPTHAPPTGNSRSIGDPPAASPGSVGGRSGAAPRKVSNKAVVREALRVRPRPPIHVSRSEAILDGVYAMSHDGWKGTLTLKGNEGSYVSQDGVAFPVQIMSDGHHVIFYVIGLGQQDADGTHGQKFDGYLMTQTRDAIAGRTWWQGQTFGFFATRKSP